MKRLILPLCLATLLLSACGDGTDERFSTRSAVVTGEAAVPPGPEWLGAAVFYQVYPQTFFDSNGDGIGDLPGIVRKLDYVKSLGADGMWINPFFESPFRDAGYDVSDYFKVAPRYGTNADAKRLFAEAHRRGLRVLFDYVVSYTSVDHPWFQASARQDSNRYTNWYIWTDNTWVNPPPPYQDSFIKGYSRRNGQFMRNFYWSQPALNFGFAEPVRPWMLPVDHPDVTALREELKGVLRYWMDMGADGFRADMAGALVKNAHIEGNDQFYRTRDEATKRFWNEIRAILDREYPGSAMVAEWSHPESALDGGGFHADFFHWFQGYNDLLQKESWRILNGYSEGSSFFDAEGRGDITCFLASYMDQYRKTRGKGYILLPLGNHDLSRLNIRRSDDDLEILFAFSLTMPGVPFLYYGNEIGMRQLDGLPHVEGAYKPRAGARTPMQWAPGRNLGFSTAAAGRLYLPVDPSPDAPTVAAQEADPRSLLNRVRSLIALRKREKALSAYAEFAPVYAVPGATPFVYARADGEERVLVAVNPSAAPAAAEFGLRPRVEGLALLAGTDAAPEIRPGRVRLSMPGRSYAIYKWR